jgi:hypothetical protein
VADVNLCFLPKHFDVIHKYIKKKTVKIFAAELHRRHPEIGVTNEASIF